MALNNRERYIRILRTLDCAELIRENKKLVKPSEKEIANPEELARLIMRRRLKEAFPSFNIRKNQEDYALRCDDEDLYNVLFLARTISQNNSFTNIIEPEYKRKIDIKLEEAFSALDLMRNRNGIRYTFKSDQKLFIYVSFLPILNQSSPTSAAERFNNISLKKRVEDMDFISKSISKIKLDDTLEDLLHLVRKDGIYNIYNMRITISEEFVKFYIESLKENSSLSIKTAVRVFKKRQIDEKTKEEILKEQELEIANLLNRREENSIPMSGIRLVDSDDEEVNEEINEDNTEEVVVQENDSFTQADFERALRTIRGDRSRAEQAITMVDSSIMRPIESHELVEIDDIENNDEEYYDDLGNMILEDDYLMYSEYINRNNRPENIKYTDVDIYDDLDKEKEGLYFIFKNGKIFHQVIVKNEVIFESIEIKEVEEKFIEIFNTEPKEIKFYME